jgi:hypothetical protein
MSVKTYDEVISQRNDHLKLDVKRLEKMVSELMNQIKVRPSQDNRRNMVNKFEKDSNIIKQASQQSNMTQPLKKQQKIIEEEKIEYARSAYLNARTYIKNDIIYKMENKHNTRVNNNDKKFIKFTKENSYQVKQNNKPANHISNVNGNGSYMPYHAFDASYILMKNNFGRVIALYVGSRHKRHNTCV